MDYSKPKGTFDILPKVSKAEEMWRSSHYYHFIESIFSDTARLYGFEEIRTPIFERTELFVRSAGETSDIASKEMYTFSDKADRSMSLRPEGTASVLRAFIENGLHTQGALHKFFYIGPFFRYDRPQAGRFRQFHQFGVEVMGDGSPEEDVEMIDMILETYRRLGLKDLHLMVNSVGDIESRQAYTQALKDFLTPYYANLTEESQMRFEKNPLRILDTKNAEEQKILKEAPSILDYLNDSCREHFERVCAWLDRLNIAYSVNDKLVRGLDYYTKTVFEVTSGALGAQNTIGAGGRYDGLMKNLGGPDIPTIGFATGIERVLYTLQAQNVLPPKKTPLIAALICMGEKAKDQGFKLCLALRHKGVASDIVYKGHKLGKGLSNAESVDAPYALIIGDQEIERNLVQIKDLKTRHIYEKPFDTIVDFMSELGKSYV